MWGFSLRDFLVREGWSWAEEEDREWEGDSGSTARSAARERSSWWRSGRWWVCSSCSGMRGRDMLAMEVEYDIETFEDVDVCLMNLGGNIFHDDDDDDDDGDALHPDVGDPVCLSRA